jgi:putative ABC transport system permease protein
MLELITGQVFHHPIRTMLCVLMIGVGLLTGLVMKGLANGVLTEKIRRTEGIGADLMIQPPHSSYLLGMGENVMPARLADKLEQVAGVAAATPVATNVSFTNRFESVFGIDLQGFERVSGPFHFVRGGPFDGPYSALVDDVYVRTHQVDVGSVLDILNHHFHVIGVVEHGKGSRVFVPLSTLQELVAPGKCSIVFVRVLSGQVQATEQELKEFNSGALRTYQITPLRELTSLISTSSIVGLRQFLRVVVILAAVISFLVIFLGLYVQVLGQTREIGILRALGATRTYLIHMFLGEAFLLCALGGVAALAMYEVTKVIVVAVYPGLTFLLPWGSTAWALAAAGVSAILGASYPAYLAARCEPMVALTYE